MSVCFDAMRGSERHVARKVTCRPFRSAFSPNSLKYIRNKSPTCTLSASLPTVIAPTFNTGLTARWFMLFTILFDCARHSSKRLFQDRDVHNRFVSYQGERLITTRASRPFGKSNEVRSTPNKPSKTTILEAVRRG